MNKNFTIISVVFIIAVLALVFYVKQLPNNIQQPVSTSNFSIKYTGSGGSSLWAYKIIITVSTTGDFEYKTLDYGTNNSHNVVLGKLSDSELKSLATIVVINNSFFSLPENLDVKGCHDASDEYIEVQSGGKSHKSSGYCVKDNSFRNIAQKLYDYQEQFAKK